MATINRDELQAIRNHVSNIPTVAGMYTAALIAWCEALLRELDCGQDGVCAAAPGCARHWEMRCRELVEERDAARAEREYFRSRVADLEWLNEANCENTPTKGCDCPGCELARDRAKRWVASRKDDNNAVAKRGREAP